MAACHMSEIYHQHIPVLLNEVISNLVVARDGIYVDATFGRGGHSRAILNQLSTQGRLIAFDKDSDAVAYAKRHVTQDTRFTIFHASFADIERYLTTSDVFGKVHGILFDLGLSSAQLDDKERGFSFTHGGKLDMRMDTSQGVDAMSWLKTVDEQELADVLWRYGDEKYSRRIARAIVARVAVAPITTAKELSHIIMHAMPRPKKSRDKHPATRSFQAIRIAINQELTQLQQGLDQALNVLMIGGRLLVISFHSLEDRLVKQFIRQHSQGERQPRGLPIKEDRYKARLKPVGKPIKPSVEEININPRARSAILRIAEKLS